MRKLVATHRRKSCARTHQGCPSLNRRRAFVIGNACWADYHKIALGKVFEKINVPLTGVINATFDITKGLSFRESAPVAFSALQPHQPL